MRKFLRSMARGNVIPLVGFWLVATIVAGALGVVVVRPDRMIVKVIDGAAKVVDDVGSSLNIGK